MGSAYDRLSSATQARLRSNLLRADPSGDPDPAERLRADCFVMLRASVDGDVPALGELLDLGLNVDFVPGGGVWGGTCALAWAASSPDPLRTARFLLARGANPNAQPPHGHQQSSHAPLHEAAHHPELLRLLLAHGADISLRSGGFTVLDSWLNKLAVPPCCHAAALEAMDVLLDAGVDPRAPLFHDGSFLVECFMSQAYDLIPALLQRGFDPHQSGKGSGWLGKSLVQRLKRYPRNPTAQGVVSAIQAHQLQQGTSSARATGHRSRL